MIATLLSLVIALAPGQAKTPDGAAIVKAAEAAGAKLKTIKYSVESKAGSSIVRATVWQENVEGADLGILAGRFRVKGSMESGGSTEFYEAAFDGRSLRIKSDSDDIRVIENPTAFEAGQHLPIAMIYSTLPMMGGHLNDGKRKFKYVGTKRVGKWMCDVVEARQQVDSPTEGPVELVAEWSFDQASHLPVRLKSSASSTVTATSFELNPKIAAPFFKMEGTVKAANKLGPHTDDLLALGSVAPDFTVDLPDGTKRRLEDYKGKIVVLDFWGTWCVPCRKVMPVLDEIHATLNSKGVEVLGISVDHEMDPVAYMKREGHTYPIGLQGYDAAEAYVAKLLPTVYVIDRQGKISFRVAGVPVDGAGIVMDEVRKLL